MFKTKRWIMYHFSSKWCSVGSEWCSGKITLRCSTVCYCPRSFNISRTIQERNRCMVSSTSKHYKRYHSQSSKIHMLSIFLDFSYYWHLLTTTVCLSNHLVTLQSLTVTLTSVFTCHCLYVLPRKHQQPILVTIYVTHTKVSCH